MDLTTHLVVQVNLDKYNSDVQAHFMNKGRPVGPKMRHRERERERDKDKKEQKCGKRRAKTQKRTKEIKAKGKG